MALDGSLLNTQYYKIWITDKWTNPGKVVAPTLKTPHCSYRKGSIQVALDFGGPI